MYGCRAAAAGVESVEAAPLAYGWPATRAPRRGSLALRGESGDSGVLGDAAASAWDAANGRLGGGNALSSARSGVRQSRSQSDGGLYWPGVGVQDIAGEAPTCVGESGRRTARVRRRSSQSSIGGIM